MFLTYKNKFNEVKAYSVEIIAEDGSYLDVLDKDVGMFKTFKQSNVLSKESTLEDAYNTAEELQKKYQISKPKRMPSRDNWNNSEGKFEICFTGFSKNEKSELTKYAKDKGFFIRTQVTKNLGLLVCGKTAGWKKLENASKLNIPRVAGLKGFYNFLETGEFTE